MPSKRNIKIERERKRKRETCNTALPPLYSLFNECVVEWLGSRETPKFSIENSEGGRANRGGMKGGGGSGKGVAGEGEGGQGEGYYKNLSFCKPSQRNPLNIYVL